MALHIDQIRTDGGTQSRAAINEATVAEYAEAMADPDTVFPAVVVYFDGRDHWLADGFHRLEAWRRIGRTEVPADVRQGDRRRAILHSVAANSAHGLRRTNDDKRRAVLTLLEDDEWRQWSDREIADRCRVSHTFVGKVREFLTGNVASETAELRTYTTKHGTTAQMDVSRSARPAAARQAPPQPELEPEPAAPEVDAAPAEPDPDAAQRRKLAGLTREALIDDVIGLRASIAETRAKLKTVTAERDALKEQLRDFQGDQAEVIRRQAKEIERLRSDAFRAGEDAARSAKAQRLLRKELDAAKRKIEAQEVPL